MGNTINRYRSIQKAIIDTRYSIQKAIIIENIPDQARGGIGISLYKDDYKGANMIETEK